MSSHLLSVVNSLDKINVQYAWLIENDSGWEQSVRDNYSTAFTANRKFLLRILENIGEQDFKLESPELDSLTPIVVDEDKPQAEGEEEEALINLVMKIEVALSKICEEYTKILDDNPSATQPIIDYYRPFRIEHAACTKSCRFLVQSYM